MKVTTIVILALLPLLHAQDAPPPSTSEVRILSQAGPLAGSTVQFVSRELINGDPVKGSPYSAEAITETTQTLADGSHIAHQSSSMLYRDSDGRERREMSLPVLGGRPKDEAPQTIFISDPIAGVHYTLDTRSHIAHKMPEPGQRSQTGPIGGNGGVRIQGGITVSGAVITPGAVTVGHIGPSQDMFYTSAAAVNGAPPTAQKVEQLGTMTIEGVEAEGTRSTTIIPAGQIGNDRDLAVVSERWYSPELKVAVTTKNSDPRSGETVYRLTRINRVEPAHALFEVPADYSIVQ